jgi:hypothetical protein
MSLPASALSNTTSAVQALYYVFQNNAMLGRVLNSYPLSKAALSKGTNYCMYYQSPNNGGIGENDTRIIQIFEAPTLVTPSTPAEASFITIAKYNNFFYGTVLSLLWAQNQNAQQHNYCKTYEIPLEAFPNVTSTRITLTAQQIIVLGNLAIKSLPLPENFCQNC